MQEGMRAMAAQANINLGALMEDVAEASKDALSYQIKSGPALAKAAAFANSIGTKFTDIANAGKSMVLNYKDSIRSEMSLSAMLGENVDLSEARALFAAGKNDEAFGVLKSSGILQKAQSQGLFAMQALQSALGGMDLEQLAAGKYEKEAFKMPSNQQFLDKLTEAQKNLRIENAFIELTKSAVLSEFELEQTKILRGDKEAINIAGELIRQDAQSFLKEQYAKLFVGGDMAKDAYNAIIEQLPAGLGKLAPTWENGPMTWLGKQVGIYDKSTGTDYMKNPMKSEKVNYFPGVSTNMTPNQAAISNLTPGTQKFDFSGYNKYLEVQEKQNKEVSSNAPIQTKVLQMAATSLQSINAQSTLQTQLLQNIQALTAATSKLGNIGLGDMRLLLDGKEVKSRIEKIRIQEKGKTRNQ
jgi:hypothetical protein